MKKIIKRVLLSLAVLIAVAVIATLYVLNRGGAFRKIEPHFAGTCEPIPLDASAEDLVLDRERDLLYLSLLDRQKLIAKEPVQGTIGVIDLKQQPLTVQDALLDRPAHLHPHGMSLYVGPDGARTLMVINHPVERSDPQKVEILTETAPGRFTHRRTVTSPLFTSPNDLVAVGPQQFYVANDRATGGNLAAALQQFGFGGSTVVWFDGEEARVAADDIASGSGINVSADGLTVYVAETSGQRIRVLERDPATGALTDKARIHVPTSPDNIDVSPDGSLTVAGHANVVKLVEHFVKGAPAPSQVLRIIPENGEAPAVDEIYLDDGEQISAGSVGVPWQDRLFIGSITARQVLACEET